MTQEEHEALNTTLAARGQMVKVAEQDGEEVYYLCDTVPCQKIEDIIAFGAIFGVVIAPPP